MRKSETTQIAHRLCGLGAAAVLVATAFAVVLGGAETAGANVLFKMQSVNCSVAGQVPDRCDRRPFPTVGGTVNGPTLMTTPTANGGADFTVPANLVTVTGSFTASYGPYPYFRGTYTRVNLGGSMMAGNWTPNATLTFIDKDTLYPYVTATPAPGRVIVKVGPQGMAGPNRFLNSTYYDFTYLTPGIVTAVAQWVSDRGGPSSTNPQIGGWSFGLQQTNNTSFGRIVGVEPNLWAFTGTVTMDQPDANLQQYWVITAMDDRTPAGASGTIQVVSAMLFHNYFVDPLPPPTDGTGTITAYASALARNQKTTFQFIPAPEPGQIALIGMGIVGLAGIARTMRRR